MLTFQDILMFFVLQSSGYKTRVQLFKCSVRKFRFHVVDRVERIRNEALDKEDCPISAACFRKCSDILFSEDYLTEALDVLKYLLYLKLFSLFLPSNLICKTGN